MAKIKYKRVLLKLSGEFLAGGSGAGLEQQALQALKDQCTPLLEEGVQLGIVNGGGNFFRGIQGAKEGFDRTVGDTVGMLATVMNALAIKAFFVKAGIPVEVFGAKGIDGVCHPFFPEIAIDYMKKGTVVIVGGGTGVPYFSTDTAAVLRALELSCDLVLKGTQVDGVFDQDPKLFEDAVLFRRLTYRTVLEKRLRVMDMTAVALAAENNIPVVVFNIHQPGALYKTLCEEGRFTFIQGS